MKNFIELPNVLGQSKATQTTVALFNTVNKIKQDTKGKYILTAVKPYRNGVIVEKKYL